MPHVRGEHTGKHSLRATYEARRLARTSDAALTMHVRTMGLPRAYLAHELEELRYPYPYP